MKMGLNVYCNRTCAGLGRRSNKTPEQKKQEKHEYDQRNKHRDIERKKAIRQAHHKRTYDPAKAAIERQKKMPRHVEYCRRPEYKKYKKAYDAQYRAKKLFGEFWEAALILIMIEKEIDSREAKKINHIYNKSQTRKRLWKSSQQLT